MLSPLVSRLASSLFQISLSECRNCLPYSFIHLFGKVILRPSRNRTQRHSQSAGNQCTMIWKRSVLGSLHSKGTHLCCTSCLKLNSSVSSLMTHEARMIIRLRSQVSTSSFGRHNVLLQSVAFISVSRRCCRHDGIGRTSSFRVGTSCAKPKTRWVANQSVASYRNLLWLIGGVPVIYDN